MSDVEIEDVQEFLAELRRCHIASWHAGEDVEAKFSHGAGQVVTD